MVYPKPFLYKQYHMLIWEFIHDKIAQGIPCLLLLVVQSEGSSPGRTGFKMCVSADNQIFGTIGGGIMEHKLVELAKANHAKHQYQTQLIPQYHDKTHAQNQSGMICSGSQTVAFIPILNTDKYLCEQILSTLTNSNPFWVQISYNEIQLLNTCPNILDTLITETNQDWRFCFALNEQPVIHIIGGGHTSLSLSQVMHFLGFKVCVYDDRPMLNTFLDNPFATHKQIIDYSRISTDFITQNTDYVVIMTIGYRPDKLVLSQLFDRPLKYLGMLGSKNKIATLKKEFLEEGTPAHVFDRIYTPIGINIHSKTTQEIAISIAAEIIRVKNQHDPSQR